MKSITSKEKLKSANVAYQSIADLLNKHSADTTAEEMLAIASNMIGKLIALQDHRTMTKEHAMEIVLHNIEIGNREIMSIMNTKGNA